MNPQTYTTNMIARAEKNYKEEVDRALYYSKRVQKAIEDGYYSEAAGLVDTVNRTLVEIAKLQAQIQSLNEVLGVIGFSS